MMNDRNSKIGIFDSGVGGSTTMNTIIKVLPNEDILFYVDNANHPYGNKSDDELYKIVCNVVDNLLKENVKIIVISCNTATTKCIDRLRNDYPNTIFVGTEPAIKVACDNNYKNILVLATPVTINAQRTHELVKQNKKPNQEIYLLPCEHLAEAIENIDVNKIDELLKLYLTDYQNKNIDSVVLGCTHYPIIKSKIQDYFKESTIIDGNEGVANRVKSILETNDLLNNKNEKGIVDIISSKKN